MGDLTLQQVVLRIAALPLIAAVHGFAVAGLASLLGDPGPRLDDRLSLNPSRHIDPLGALLLVVFALGWIRPIAIDPAKRIGRAGLPVIVLGANEAATPVLALLARVARPFVLTWLPNTAAATAFVFVDTLSQLCLSFALLNLLPAPPLTGQHWLVAARPAWRQPLTRLQPWAMAAAALLTGSGIAGRCLAPSLSLLDAWILGE